MTQFPRTVSPAEAKQMIAAGDAILIDIREADEVAREHIPGARSVPLSRLEQADFSSERAGTAIFLCRSGTRTRDNFDRLAGTGFTDVRHLAGGLQAWKAAGYDVRLNPDAPIDMMRQVQIAAGSLVLIGSVLGAFVTPWGIALSAFVGAGLTFAGLTGTCGMARLLSVMPWNRRAGQEQP